MTTEEVKNEVKMVEKEPKKFNTCHFIKKWSWKFFGALFMRDKGENGTSNQAISAHKTFGLLVFVACVGIWIFGGTHLTNEQTMALLEADKALPSKWGAPPDMMVYSWWALLGVSMANGILDLMNRK